MGKLLAYRSLAEKQAFFNADRVYPDVRYFKIDQAYEFNDWYNEITAPAPGQQNGDIQYNIFFRGVNEAKFKLYNSAQRYWIQNNLMQLESLTQPLSYLKMIQNMVDRAKEVRLLQQVFKYYGIGPEQMDFPILSILQHYKAPTPLMDWTYDVNIALFFAIMDVKRSDEENVIDDYVSIYKLEKNIHSSFLENNLNYVSGNIFPQVSWLGEILKQRNSLIYISDFEISQFEDKEMRKIKPITTYYNLNILAQNGIFVFNPLEATPLEEFHQFHNQNGADHKIFCYNICKDLAELIKYKISKSGVSYEFLFPNLEQYSQRILDDYLRFVVG
jgi:hypothetical protein